VPSLLLPKILAITATKVGQPCLLSSNPKKKSFTKLLLSSANSFKKILLRNNNRNEVEIFLKPSRRNSFAKLLLLFILPSVFARVLPRVHTTFFHIFHLGSWILGHCHLQHASWDLHLPKCARRFHAFFNAIGAEEESTKRKTKRKKSTGAIAVLTAASSQI